MFESKHMLGLALPAVAFAAALCLAEEAGTEGQAAEALRSWTPPQIEPGSYDDITAYNIFKPNRSALVSDAEREPELPEDPRPIEPVIELPPLDPDASLMLVGISVRGDRHTAFIENRATGETVEVDRPGEFSQGEVTAIAYNKLTYVIDDETREICVGFAFTGERVATPPPTRAATTPGETPGGSTPDETDSTTETGGEAPPVDGLSDLERRMRERRNSE